MSIFIEETDMKSIKQINEQMKEDTNIIIDTPELIDLFNYKGIDIENMIDEDEQLMIHFPPSTTERNIDYLDVKAHQYAQLVLKSLVEKFHKSPQRVGLIGDIDTLSYLIGRIVQNYSTFSTIREEY